MAWFHNRRTDRTCEDRKGHQMGHHLDTWDIKWDTILPGWDTILPRWDTILGHKGTPTDTILTSAGVMEEKARGGASTRFSGAERPKNEVRVSKADLEPFGDFGCLWYNPLYRFSAQQGRRHGVRSRSLGGTYILGCGGCSSHHTPSSTLSVQPVAER